MNPKELWQTVLAEIELSISKANFITWFKNTKIQSKKDGVITVSAPSGFAKEWLENKYNKQILKILRNNSPDVKEIQFIIGGQTPIIIAKRIGKRLIPNLVSDQLNFQEFTLNKETNLNPKYTFNNFVIGSFNELAQAAARAVTKNLGTLYNPLFIYGGVGLGKTHLLQAIGNELTKKHPSRKIK
ncbi:MAG: DnaA/Hda family protein, partial [Patescibacteria group bacterium]